MNKALRLLAPAAALAAFALQAAPMPAQAQEAWTGQAELSSLNDSGTSGDMWISVDGTEATVRIEVTGAAATFMDGPFPHAQHVHIGAEGTCPTVDEADEDGDGVVSTPEGHPFYGHIGTSLTTEGDTSADSALAVERFPGGAEYSYERTFEINQDTAQALADGSAVVVVHGVDPERMPEAAAGKMSPLDDSLPLAATLPAACGAVELSQMGDMPEGGAETGVTSDTSAAAVGLLMAGLGVTGIAGAALLHRRRVQS